MANIGVLADQCPEIVAFEQAGNGTRESDRKDLARVVIDSSVIFGVKRPQGCYRWVVELRRTLALPKRHAEWRLVDGSIDGDIGGRKPRTAVRIRRTAVLVHPCVGDSCREHIIAGMTFQGRGQRIGERESIQASFTRGFYQDGLEHRL